MENGSAPDGITTTGRRFHDHGHGMTMENGSAPDGITTTGRRFHDHGHGMTLGGSALRPLWALCELTK